MSPPMDFQKPVAFGLRVHIFSAGKTGRRREHVRFQTRNRVTPSPRPPSVFASTTAVLTCFRVAAHPHVVVPDFHVLDALSELLEVHRQHDAVCLHVSVPKFGNETLVQDAGHLAVHGRVRYVGHVRGGDGVLISVEARARQKPGSVSLSAFYTRTHANAFRGKGKGVLPRRSRPECFASR